MQILFHDGYLLSDISRLKKVCLTSLFLLVFLWNNGRQGENPKLQLIMYYFSMSCSIKSWVVILFIITQLSKYNHGKNRKKSPSKTAASCMRISRWAVFLHGEVLSPSPPTIPIILSLSPMTHPHDSDCICNSPRRDNPMCHIHSYNLAWNFGQPDIDKNGHENDKENQPKQK